MGFVDTGMNVPESLATLQIQQAQLVAGKRHVQMFPAGERELGLPAGFSRHLNARGVFHFNPTAINAQTIDMLGSQGRENEVLNLGPFNKSDIARRMDQGEPLVTIAEFNRDGVEIRAAAGTAGTIPHQLDYFEKTKDAGNTVLVCNFAHLIAVRMAS